MIFRFIKYLLFSLLLGLTPTAFGADATPVGPPTAPSTISARLANPGSTTNTDVIVEWSGGSDGGSAVTGYQVTPYLGPDYTSAANVSCSTPGPNLSDSCTVSGLAFATSYKFKITRTTSINSATSEFTNVVSTGSQAQNVLISGAPSSYQFGDPDFQLTATADSGLPVTWSVPTTTDVCSVDLSGTVHFLKSGTCTVRATQDGNGSSYASAFDEESISSIVSLSATLGPATSVQSSQATLNAIVPYPGVDVTPTFCVSRTNSVSSCSLPSGVSIGSYSPTTITASSSTSLTAVASGLTQNTTYYFWLTVSGSGASPYSTGTGSFTTVSGPSLAYSGSTSGTVGTSLSGTLTASSGSGVYASWSAASLPTGLTFSPGVTATTSSLSGTPTAAGNYSALFTVTDSSGLETQLNVTFTIAAEQTNNNSNNNTNNNSDGNSSSGSSGGSIGSGGTTTGPTTPAEPVLPTGKATTAGNTAQAPETDSSIGGIKYLFRDSSYVDATVDTADSSRGLIVTAMDWGVTATAAKSKLIPNDSGELDRRLASQISERITINGFGFKPGTQVDAYLFSDPTWLGGFYADKQGEFEFSVTIPRTISTGSHVLQIIGVGPQSQKQYANLPIFITPRGESYVYLADSLVAKTIQGPIRTTVLLKDVPLKAKLSFKNEVNDKTRGVKFASIKLRLITVTPDQGFSGVILLPVVIKYLGVTVTRNVAITVLPTNPRTPAHAIRGLNETLISWRKSLNANRYSVTLNDVKICETSGASCIYKGIAGPNSRFSIQAIGADGTVSASVESKYLQSKPRLLATVNFANNSSSLDAKAITNLQTLIQVLMKEGFSKINIVGYTDSVGKKAANQKLSAARAKAVSDFISGNIVGAVESFGRGKAKPLKSNATKDGRAANRRVEIFVY